MRLALVRLTLLFTTAALSFAQTPAPATPAQTEPPAATPAPATPPATPVWSVGGIDFSGLVDGYYSLNFNHPASLTNQVRNFDVRANQFSLNMAKLSLEHTPDPVGFRVDFGFGRAFEIFHATEPLSSSVFRNIEQAFISFKPAQAKGLQVDFGKFVTSAGAELTETNLNWNYSRSLLFANGPYYHFGLRTAMPLNKNLTVGAQVVNGWNNVEDNNTGKTVGLTDSLTIGKVVWSNNYYFGPEKTGVNQGYRHFYDTVLTLTNSDKANFYINFDYGVDKNVDRGSKRFLGIAGAFHYAPTTWFSLTPRAEWYNDADGFITGTRQKLKEFTMTGEFKMAQGFLTRLEYRRDWSDQPFFDRGAGTANYKNQDTVLIGFVAFFGPKR